MNARVSVYAFDGRVWYALLQRWAPVAIGLLSIPAIIHPIDDFTDSMMNKTYGGAVQAGDCAPVCLLSQRELTCSS